MRVEGCIIGGELYAAGLRQPSWCLDERSHPSQMLSRGISIDRHHFHLTIPLCAPHDDDNDLSKLGEHFHVRAEEGGSGLREIVIPRIDKISMMMFPDLMS